MARSPSQTTAAARSRFAARSPVARDGDVGWLVVRGARHNNLKGIDVAFPLGRFTCVTGVSGSGKSSLVNEILYPALARALHKATTREPGAHAGIDGLAQLDKVIAIDQSPIGRTPRSNPATYIKLFDEIRALFAKLPDAKLRGYRPGRFSFNVPTAKGGGRCEACEGNGSNRIEMDFLADVWVTCPVCEGARFSRETLQIRFKGHSIADVLRLEVGAALELFDNQPRIRGMLTTLHDVGLDYIQLGQSSTTLSGGEAQRIKLARELVKRPTGRTLYVLDEPTTGLHFADVRRLLSVLHGFVDAGNTVVVIEHNLDVIKTADWIIDLGPEGGEGGGRIVAEGPPETLAAHPTSETGRALRAVLAGAGAVPAERVGAGARTATPSDGSAAEPSAAGPPAERTFAADAVTVVGARQHNLKDLTVAFPRDRLTVCTGVSGSGKTSFAIDTVFAEGYRRYVESLPAYARQFLGQLAKPRVDHVEGLSPAICIEQRATGKSPRSTVGTVTEIYDYMRVLWARVGTRFCPRCQVPIGTQTADDIIDRVMSLPEATPIVILAPVSLGDGETYATLFHRLKSSGYTRVRIDGRIELTAQATTLDARQKHRVEVVVDRTVVRARSRGRVAESIEHALALGNGLMTLLVEDVELVEEAGGAEGAAAPAAPDAAAEGAAEPAAPGAGAGADEPSPRAAAGPRIQRVPGRTLLFSQKLACTHCGTSYEELGPNHFSFNSQLGWCETCEGLGVQRGAPAAAILAHPERGLLDGAIAGWPRIDRRAPLGRLLVALCRHLGVAPETPLAAWTAEQKRALLFGTGASGERGGWIAGDAAFPGTRFRWRGFFPALDHATRTSWSFRWKLRNTVTDIPCVTCRGGRLRPEPAAVRLIAADDAPRPDDPPGRTIGEVCELPLDACLAYFRGLRLDARQRQIAGDLLKEICDRLQFLIDVGLHYLTLNRPAPTLSGGEAQRIRLASQIGSGLSGVLYVLDEPTIGLHPRDTQRLIRALVRLRELGNTLLLVEHDRDVIRAADHLLDFGPRAGADGGHVVAQGPPQALRIAPAPTGGERDESPAAQPKPWALTAGYLDGTLAIPVPTERRPIPPWRDAAGEDESAASGLRPSEVRVVPVDDEGREVAPRRPGKRRRPTGTAPPDAALPGAAVEADAFPGWLVVRGARQHNLKNLTVPIPLGRLVCVTGVSGSGKSSLVSDILAPALLNLLHHGNQSVGEHDRLEYVRPDGRAAPVAAPSPRNPGLLDRVINVDQTPIGSTPLSNPATYTGVFDDIRELFARLPESKLRGYTANRFSFNRPGGRCEACEGYGQRCIEMHFMPDVWVECETCRGQRYNPETLAVRYRGKTIADVLALRVAEALRLFENVPRVRRMLQTLADVGLDYVPLGQPAPTLSGGEAQRVKLAAELGKPDVGRTLYLLDEPTTGLHFEDIRKLLAVLHRLVDFGHSVLVVEHNLDVLKSADWIIDLGPEAGADGGYLVAAGPPEALVAQAAEGPWPSHTATALAPVLAAGPRAPRPRVDRAALAAEALAAARGGFGDVGRAVRMPWQVDGRKWHLEQRSSRAERPRRWEPAALEYVLELVQREGAALGGLFAETNWNNRASVEVTARGASMWFLHALTGGEWLLELYFRTPPGTFQWAALDEQLGLKTLDERTDLAAYGNWSRVDVRPRRDGWDAVVVYVHDRAEIDTPGFRKFIRAAVRAYAAAVRPGGA